METIDVMMIGIVRKVLLHAPVAVEADAVHGKELAKRNWTASKATRTGQQTKVPIAKKPAGVVAVDERNRVTVRKIPVRDVGVGVRDEMTVSRQVGNENRLTKTTIWMCVANRTPSWFRPATKKTAMATKGPRVVVRDAGAVAVAVVVVVAVTERAVVNEPTIWTRFRKLKPSQVLTMIMKTTLKPK